LYVQKIACERYNTDSKTLKQQRQQTECLLIIHHAITPNVQKGGYYSMLQFR